MLENTLIIHIRDIKILKKNDEGKALICKTEVGNTVNQVQIGKGMESSQINVKLSSNDSFIRFEIWDSENDFLGGGSMFISNSPDKEWIVLKNKTEDVGQLLVETQMVSKKPTGEKNESYQTTQQPNYFPQPQQQQQQQPPFNTYYQPTGPYNPYQQQPSNSFFPFYRGGGGGCC